MRVQLLLWAIGLAQVTLFAQSPDKFYINGRIGKDDYPAQRVILRYSDKEGKRVEDTSKVLNEQFKFEGSLSEPSRVSMKILTDSVNFRGVKIYPFEIFFCADNSKIQMHIRNREDFIISGSVANDDQNRFRDIVKPQIDSIKSSAAIMTTRAERKAMEEFIRMNPKSPYSLILLFELSRTKKELGNLDSLFNLLPASLQQLPSGKAIAEKIMGLQRVSIGETAPDFALPDRNGNTIKLSQFRGKYVLVEFWGSGCTPCRQENPHLVKAYAALKDKNFEILGISLEKSTGRSAWLKAIEKDGLPWIHVCDFKDFKSPVAKSYGVSGIPSNFLVDPSGKIIANNLRGENVLELLKQYIK
jgi:peroxiredoxin